VNSSGLLCSYEVDFVSLGHVPLNIDSQRAVAGLLNDLLPAVGDGDSAEDIFVLPDEAVLCHFDFKRRVHFTRFNCRVGQDLFDAEWEPTELENSFSAECPVMRDFADDFPNRASLDGAANQVDGDVRLANAQRDER